MTMNERPYNDQLSPPSAIDVDDLAASLQAKELERFHSLNRREQAKADKESDVEAAILRPSGDPSPVEAMVLQMAREDEKAPRISLTKNELMSSSNLHKPQNVQEPAVLADRIVARNISEVSTCSTLSNISGFSDDGGAPMSPLEIVARQAARSKGKAPGLSGRPQSKITSPSDDVRRQLYSMTSPATEEPSSSAKRISFTREEPGGLVVDARRRSDFGGDVSGIFRPRGLSNASTASGGVEKYVSTVSSTSVGGRRVSTVASGVVDVDEIEEQRREPKPAVVGRGSSANSMASTRSSLLIGPGAEEFARIREEMNSQASSSDKQKAGHLRWSGISKGERRSSRDANAESSGTEDTLPRSQGRSREELEAKRQGLSPLALVRGASGASTATNPASSGMEDSKTLRSHRTLQDFEAKRKALPTSQICASQVATPVMMMMMDLDTTQPMVIDSTKAAKTEQFIHPQNPNSPTRGKNVVTTIATPVQVHHVSHTSSTSAPPIAAYRVQGRALSQEQLVEARLIRQDSSTNHTDTEKGENFAVENQGGSGFILDSVPPPIPRPPLDDMNVDLIVQAHPAKATDSAQDLLCSHKGRCLLSLLIVLVVLVAGGVALGVVKGNNKGNYTTDMPDSSNHETLTPVSAPTGSPTLSPAVATSAPSPAAPVGSMAPTTAKYGYVVSLLPNYTLSSLGDPDSPQSKALEWLVDGHTPAHFANLSDARLLQRFALAVFFFATNGIGWRWAQYWLSADDPSVSECDWWSHYDFTDRSVSTCDEDGLLVRVALNENILRGTLPKELALLTNVIEISLIADAFFVAEENKKEQLLTGSIPEEWMMGLTSLKTLDLSRNAISGSIPTEIGLLQNLTTLNLLENYLDSEIPSELFRLTNLKQIWLNDNRLRGTLPTQIGQWKSAPALETFSIAMNQLSGSLPSELGELIHLKQLLIASNIFSGTIPVEITNLSHVSWLSLEDNHLTGTIHTEFGKLTKLNKGVLSGGLWMGRNRLNGTIPTELGMMTDISNVGMNDNQLSGTIPSELGLWNKVNQVNLEGNDLTGTVPALMCRPLGRILFRVYVDCLEVKCTCICCWCDCVRGNQSNATAFSPISP